MINMGERDPHLFEKYMNDSARIRRHPWAVTVGHRITDATLAELHDKAPLLDGESILIVTVGCLACEVEFDRKLLGTSCPGDPRLPRPDEYILCRGTCGKEYLAGSPALCKTHGLCGFCHPDDLR